MIKYWEGYFSEVFLSATSLSWFWTLKRLFELTGCLSTLPSMFFPELQRYKDSVWSFNPMHRGPRILSRTSDANVERLQVIHTFFL